MARVVFASDVDGTLLRTDGTASERTRTAIGRSQAAQVPFLIATGRPIRSIPPVLDQIGELSVAVCSNGAIVYDPKADLILAASHVPADEMRYAIEALGRFDDAIGFAVDYERTAAVDTMFASEWGAARRELPPQTLIVPTGELAVDRVTKLVAWTPRHSAADLAAATAGILDGRVQVTWGADRRGSFLEISAAGVHKASALQQVVEGFGSNLDEVVAFGDMRNDLEMIQSAGHGVAMSNAHEQLRSVADEITATNDEDGVALVMERILAG